jgi:hypothetical protein
VSRRVAGLSAVVLALAWAASAHATPIHVALSASNGSGNSDPSLPCGTGDGPSWNYGWSNGAGAVGGPLSGGWSGNVEVHQALDGIHGFVPSGTGRVRLDVARGGTLDLQFGSGSCTTPTWSVSGVANDVPDASGSAPFTVTAGSGTLRHVTGSGTANASLLQLHPGASNSAAMALDGNLSVLSPHLSMGGVGLQWLNLWDLLTNQLTVYVPIVNAAGPDTTGDAYSVQMTSAKLNGVPAQALPATIARINESRSVVVGLRFSGVYPNTQRTLTVTLAAKDALDGSVAPVTQSQTFTVPLLYLP